MPKLEITPVQPGDAAWIARNLRRSDVSELAALGHSPMVGVINSLAADPDAAVLRVVETGEPVCVFGLHIPVEPAFSGIPWMLGTDLIAKYRKEFMRVSLRVSAGWRKQGRNLFNICYAKNTATLRWLTSLGFSIDLTPIRLPGGVFYKFTRDDNVHSH